ncbi:MAG: PQQ-dependent sugar dehydrogenase [Propionibacteriales bacterium]|nr:PQQ-dependent sugar dehydrogenase [Propionibacteriales bacterium]
MRRLGYLTTALAATAALVLPTGSPVVASTPAPTARGAAIPSLSVTQQVTGLDIPWDVQVLPGGRLLIDERVNRRLIVATGSSKRVLGGFPSAKIWAAGETGMLGLAVDPAFSDNRRIYTCSGWVKADGGHDVRVVAWELNAGYTAVKYLRTLVLGFPTSTGRHGGCRLLITRTGALIVGTGDAAQTPNAQSLRSFGGKTLRLNRFTGAPWPTNPWPNAASKVRRYILTYGHRNVQGLTQRADGSLWSVEHGTYRDDEVNRLVSGGNFGWRPGPGYDESPPMTNYALPGPQYGARWRSGDPTVATSGATWVSGAQWGSLNGTLAVATLKANKVIFMKFDQAGKLLWTRTPAALQTSGRLRSVTKAPNGDLLITTSNGSGQDAVLRVHPTL